MVNVRRIGNRFGVPPFVAAVDQQQGDGQGDGARRSAPGGALPGPGAKPGSRRDWPTAAATMPTIPTTSRMPSNASVMPMGRCMGRMESGIAGTGTLAAGLACGAVDIEVHLPGAGGHQPKRAGEESWVGRRSLHGVRTGRMLRGFAGQRGRRDARERIGSAGTPHFNRGHARNDVRRADGDEELVRPGVHLLENILAADVRVSRRRLTARRQEKPTDPPSSLHATHPAAEQQTDPGGDDA